MSDNIGGLLGKFFKQRSRPLWERFPGSYRAVVVETNDPLSMMRIRVKCPDLHDYSLSAQDCPFATAAHDLGGKRTGHWTHPCIGDWVWISFEKGHPYSIIWTGFANPTRRKFYPYPQITQITPLSLNDHGKPNDPVVDYDVNYLPKDGRPMSSGTQDRYGNLDIISSVGFFPKEHDRQPPPPDHDAVQGAVYKIQQSQPEVNNPDKKYMARVTKYGNMFILSDQGYQWKEEFTGDFATDEQFEMQRWKMMQRLLNEDEPTGDQRRIMLTSRYGSRFEIRDTGWNKSRSGEFGDSKTISDSTDDCRWIKLRTKAGMLFQMYDKGADSENDNFIKRPLIDECGLKSEKENEYFKDKDGRFMRMVTRWGIKFVLDDRGSDRTQAENLVSPTGNGWLLKGRRAPGVKGEAATGVGRGFFFEANENDAANHTMWGTPMGLAIEMNDRYQYALITASMGQQWSAENQGVKENEFIRTPAMKADAEHNSYHLKLDHDNEYLRLKTRGNHGPSPQSAANKSDVSASNEIQQGLEARDGVGEDGPWTEVVDCQNRGFWFSKKQQIGIWRSQQNNNMFMWMDDKGQKVVIYNSDNGGVEVYSNGAINLVSAGTITLSGKQVNIIGADGVTVQGGGSRMTFGQSIASNIDFHAPQVHASKHVNQPQRSGPAPVIPSVPQLPVKIVPTDRGKTYNGPFVECPIGEVEHKI